MIPFVSLLLECKMIKRYAEKHAAKFENPSVAAYKVLVLLLPAVDCEDDLMFF